MCLEQVSPSTLLGSYLSSKMVSGLIAAADALFSLRLLCESAWNKQQTLFFCMLDLTKAFGSVNRDMAWHVLLSRGVPQKLVTLIKDLRSDHINSQTSSISCSTS